VKVSKKQEGSETVHVLLSFLRRNLMEMRTELNVNERGKIVTIKWKQSSNLFYNCKRENGETT